VSTTFAKMLQQAKQSTPENADITEDVLAIARGWQRGELPLSQVRVLCTGYDRFVALNHCGIGSDDRAVLMALLDAIVAELDRAERSEPTKHGTITTKDMGEAIGRISFDRQHRRVIQFPVDVNDGWPIYREIPEHVTPEDAP
jgi:hypothetical protein